MWYLLSWHSLTHRLLICAGVCYKLFDIYVNPRARVSFLAASSTNWCAKLFYLKTANDLLSLTLSIWTCGDSVKEMDNIRLTCSLFWEAVRSFSSLVPRECNFLACSHHCDVSKIAADESPVTWMSCFFEEFSTWFFYYSLILFCFCILILLAQRSKVRGDIWLWGKREWS